MEFSIKDGTLYAGDQPARCPFQPPMLLPNPLAGGQPTISYQSCNTGCAIGFNLLTKENEDGKKEYKAQLFCVQRPIDLVSVTQKPGLKAIK